MVPPPAGAAPGTPVSAVPAKRPITIRDLLTHTAGIGYGAGPAEPLYKSANVYMLVLRGEGRAHRDHDRSPGGVAV